MERRSKSSTRELKPVTSSYQLLLKELSNYFITKSRLRFPFRGQRNLYHYIFNHRLSIQHSDYTMTITGIMFGVRYHDNGSSLFIQVR